MTEEELTEAISRFCWHVGEPPPQDDKQKAEIVRRMKAQGLIKED